MWLIEYKMQFPMLKHEDWFFTGYGAIYNRDNSTLRYTALGSVNPAGQRNMTAAAW